MKTIHAVFAVSILTALLVAAVMFMIQPSHIAQAQGPTGSFVLYPYGSDPCQNPSIAKKFAVVNISTATTTELVAATAGKVVYLCSLKASIAGTTPTVLFLTGTKVSTACDTTPTNQSGTYLLPTTTMQTFESAQGSFLTGALGGELCVTTAGSGVSLQGNLVYITQ